MQVHINLSCLFILLLSNLAIAQTTYTTTPRTARAIRHSTLGTWTNFTAAALAADDNNYMEFKFAPSWSSSDRLVCRDFDFSDIPDNATIDKLFLKIIRFKKGKADVTDLNVYFSKHGNDQVMGPNLKKSGNWPSTEGAAYYEENGSSSGSSNPNEPGAYGPYTYTPADIKSPDFNVYIVAWRNGNQNNFYIDFEQVQVSIQYTVPAAVTTTQQKADPQEKALDLKQHNRNVFFKGLEKGQYHLTVTDLSGCLLQQTVINNSGEQKVPLNDRCRGYCIISIEGNGRRKTLKAYIQ
ncbi:hypothetical protein HRH25_02925 [Flavisolibacter sp. BT320]|nr:hypothetical protein [Flavisolibacter longurius]